MPIIITATENLGFIGDVFKTNCTSKNNVSDAV